MTREDTLKPLKFEYVPRVQVAFSENDIFSLFLYAEVHYDFHCRLAAKQGGILWGLKNRIENGFAVDFLTCTEVDLLAKICEADPMMFKKLCNIMRSCATEYEKLNK